MSLRQGSLVRAGEFGISEIGSAGKENIVVEGGAPGVVAEQLDDKRCKVIFPKGSKPSYNVSVSEIVVVSDKDVFRKA